MVAAGRYNITVHAAHEMLDEGFEDVDIEEAVGDDDPEVVEDYPDHLRGPCFLVLGWSTRLKSAYWRFPRCPLHILLTYGRGEPSVITVYEPNRGKWVTPRRRKR